MELPLTAVGGGVAVGIASKEIITRFLGPTAEYLGEELKNSVEKCNINLNDIFQKAVRKSGERLNEEALVNPRVLKSVVTDGSYCDDDTLKEYYAGILASSRTTNATNDIGVSREHSQKVGMYFS